MPTFSKAILSSASGGRPILVTGTSASGTLIHTAATGIGDNNDDEVYLYAHNTSTAAVVLTVAFGGIATKDQIKYTVPSRDGLHLIVPGLPLNTSKAVRAGAATANVIAVAGFVNKMRA
jgi:hypothetical protein